MRPGLRSRKPVAREARHYAAADQRNQQNDGRNAGPHGKISAAAEMRFQMKRHVARSQNDEERDDFQIAPVFSRHNFARGGAGNEQQKCAVDRGRRDPAGQRR